MAVHTLPDAVRDVLGWRSLLRPMGVLWVGLAAVTAASGDGRLPLPYDWRAVLLAGLAVLAVGILHQLTCAVVARLWLTTARTGVAASLIRHRSRAWHRANTAARKALDAGEEPEFQRQTGLRNRIALAAPERATWMGDRHRSLEVRVRGQYGLDFAVVWPRLSLILPDRARADLRVAIGGWHRAVEAAAWAVVYLPLVLQWWPVVGLAGALLGWAWGEARRITAIYTDLAESFVDLYAVDLVTAMRLGGPVERLDQTKGWEVTAILRKGG